MKSQKKRIQAMISMIPSNGYIMVKDLSETFKVTEETIRRDLLKICEENPSIRKVHGGVYRTAGDDLAAPQGLRSTLLTGEKTRFADFCASLAESGNCIMLDSSTTAMFVARALNARKINLVVVTNSMQTALVFQENEDVQVVLAGGKLRKTNGSLIGSSAISMLRRYCADLCVVSPTSIDRKFGLTDHNEEEATIRECMLQCSKKRILVADHTKFGWASTNVIAPIDGFDMVVTDKAIPAGWTALLDEKGIAVTYC
ncbi:MAG: DeoR/GlpR family DNA-binding transcription regulator [Sphaerochaeta sp.]